MTPYDRYPRTLQEAFGPYTDNRVEVKGEPPPMDTSDRIVVFGSIVALILLAGILYCEYTIGL